MIGGTWEEPKKVIHALKDLRWIEAMQEELLQFKLQKVWTLVDLPNRKRAIGSKWVFRNKKDEMGIVIRNKARLEGYHKKKGLTMINTFLYGKIEEEVYVCQPPGFEDPDFPDRVYKVEKALYGLHQDPKAWYETLSTYLLDNGFQKRKIDKTLFIKRHKAYTFDLVAYTDSDYDRASLDRKSTTGEKAKKSVRLMMEKLVIRKNRQRVLVRKRIERIATVKEKTINGEVQLQALVDGKKIIITESTMRRDIQLEDVEGVDCLPNATIFEQLALIGNEQILQCLSSKTTAWNEFSSTMASAIICLATNQKFNFSKYIFESMVKNLDNVGKFLMYPRFIQVFLDKQLEGMPTHNKIYIAPSHTKKIFGNMRRVKKDFSGRITPLFPTMVVQNQAEMGEGSSMPTDPHHTPTIIQPSPQHQKKQKPRKPKRKDTQIP
ncbi:putative ribonuclease H-like domain-containing protein [Tanacetum coccineum]